MNKLIERMRRICIADPSLSREWEALCGLAYPLYHAHLARGIKVSQSQPVPEKENKKIDELEPLFTDALKALSEKVGVSLMEAKPSDIYEACRGCTTCATKQS
jgi:hypothetical protein